MFVLVVSEFTEVFPFDYEEFHVDFHIHLIFNSVMTVSELSEVFPIIYGEFRVEFHDSLTHRYILCSILAEIFDKFSEIVCLISILLILSPLCLSQAILIPVIQTYMIM